MKGKVLVIDFGSQYTQIIARRIRELNVFCEILPYNHLEEIDEYSAIILSGSPYSVKSAEAPQIDLKPLVGKKPILGICYGAQYIAQNMGGEVASGHTREYGKAHLKDVYPCAFLEGVSQDSQVWMSHGDTIKKIPTGAQRIASTTSVENVAYSISDKQVYGIQFHPEVYHTKPGKQIFKNFLIDIVKITQDWTPGNFIEITIENIRKKIGNDKVVLGLSGGVDSTVAAVLLHKAIGKNLHCIFVNNGLLRKDEFSEVLNQYKGMDLNVKGVDATKIFMKKLRGVVDPEQKRKIIGQSFIEVFEAESSEIKDVSWLAQGTIYPDVIESISVNGPSVNIKSHHNVGGLPEQMSLKIIEPLKMLFKDEVRLVGVALDIPNELTGRHPFPGPGLAIRILGEITPEAVKTLQEVDAIFISELKNENLYNKIWQAGAILLPIKSVGVMGDERTYEKCVALRAVESTDGMTADWVQLPYDFLQKISNEIINKVRGVNRVVYDISSKPPATIEWE